ncbi:MAG: PhoH family protein [Verrucomicrobium sp.]|nr:PhoH family protein [Verrucomicrobium sp.]
MHYQSEFIVSEVSNNQGSGERLGVDLNGLRVKNYVLDTNVLLHDPQSLFHFVDNDVWIPVEVLAELDKFKNEQSERGANARAVHRNLTKLFSKEHSEQILGGAATPAGGTVRIAVNDFIGRKKRHPEMDRFLKVFPDMEKIDHRILACCLYVHHQSPRPTILVTKDLNMQLKAMVLGIPAEDYLTDKVEAKDVESFDLPRFEVTPNELQRFASTQRLGVGSRSEALTLNEYVLLTASEAKTMPARYRGDGTFQRLSIPERIHIPKGIDIRPMNLGQQCFLDALLDPEISLVTCYGQAGTGKTLMAIAAGLNRVYDSQYDGITISRPVVPMGESVGFLPGTLEEKMRPWLQCIYDALEVLLPAHAPKAPPFAGKKQSNPARKAKNSSQKDSPQQSGGAPGAPLMKPYERLVEQGLLEIEALAYIRGRSIPRRYFVLDEAQQLTPLEAKTIVTRMSKGSKLIMVGDPAQIDNPYVDSRSNGLVYTRTRLKGEAITAHISLSKGERSALAEIGAQRM